MTMQNWDENSLFSEDQLVALRVLKCVLGEKKCVYVATPITGGRRFLRWHRKYGCRISEDHVYQTALRKFVIGPNTASACKRVEQLREKGGSFLNPSELFVSSWSDEHYTTLWLAVMSRYAEGAVFLDGWHLSRGCVNEFFVAKSIGFPVLDQRGERLSVRNGLNLMREGLFEFRESGHDVGVFDSAISGLAALSYRPIGRCDGNEADSA